MYQARIAAAEEIQLLLPDDAYGSQGHLPVMLLGLGILLVTAPFWAARLMEGRTASK